MARLVFLFTLLAFATAHADQPAEFPALVKALSKYVVVLNEPVYVYNWFNSNGRNPIWQQQLSAFDPAGLDHAKNSAHSYFQAFCTNDPAKDPADCTSDDPTKLPGRGNMYGPGLYASTDPIATAAYGIDAKWVMLEMHLPKMFRFASVAWNLGDGQLSDQAKSELQELKCDVLSSYSTAQDVLATGLSMGNANNGARDKGTDKQTCMLNLRHLFRDLLKIDGVYYGYSASSFNVCENSLVVGRPGATQTMNGNSLRQGAFVLANLDKLKPSDVKVFTSKTRDATSDRVRLSTLFYNITGTKNDGTIQYYNANGIPNLPGYKVRQFIANGCYALGNYPNTCGDWYYVCDSSLNCQYAPLPAPPADAVSVLGPLKISSSLVPGNMPAGQLLWSDLDGVDQMPKIEDWIRANLLGCRDIAPFGATPNLRYGIFRPKSNIPATPATPAAQ